MSNDDDDDEIKNELRKLGYLWKTKISTVETIVYLINTKK
jgi:DNA polymerase III delta subunit